MALLGLRTQNPQKFSHHYKEKFSKTGVSFLNLGKNSIGDMSLLQR